VNALQDISKEHRRSSEDVKNRSAKMSENGLSGGVLDASLVDTNPLHNKVLDDDCVALLIVSANDVMQQMLMKNRKQNSSIIPWCECPNP
jgi:hypothetical protein